MPPNHQIQIWGSRDSDLYKLLQKQTHLSSHLLHRVLKNDAPGTTDPWLTPAWPFKAHYVTRLVAAPVNPVTAVAVVSDAGHVIELPDAGHHSAGVLLLHGLA